LLPLPTKLHRHTQVLAQMPWLSYLGTLMHKGCNPCLIDVARLLFSPCTAGLHAKALLCSSPAVYVYGIMWGLAGLLMMKPRLPSLRQRFMQCLLELVLHLGLVGCSPHGATSQHELFATGHQPPNHGSPCARGRPGSGSGWGFIWCGMPISASPQRSLSDRCELSVCARILFISSILADGWH
jgi:hypothetical protein